MNYTTTLLVTVPVVAAALVAMWAAWRVKVRRDNATAVPDHPFPDEHQFNHRVRALYLATTRQNLPLERLALRGLAFRRPVDVLVGARGIGLEFSRSDRLFLPHEILQEFSQATVTIDRVVEPGGLLKIAWLLDTQTVVDSYFRPQDTSARSALQILRDTIPTERNA